MIDRTPVIDNVEWPDCVKKELQKEKIGENQRGIVEQNNDADLMDVNEIPTFNWIDAKAVVEITNENLMMLDPSRIWEDAICYHDETLAKYPEIHNKIGHEKCTLSAK